MDMCHWSLYSFTVINWNGSKLFESLSPSTGRGCGLSRNSNRICHRSRPSRSCFTLVRAASSAGLSLTFLVGAFHTGLPFPQVVEHSVVPSCFQLWSRLLLGGCGAAGTRLSGRWEGNLSGCLTGKVWVDSDVNTSGASPCGSSFSWTFSLSSLASWPPPSVSNCPLKGSPRRGSTPQR